MGVRSALVTGTVVSLVVVSARSYVASVAIGLAVPLHLGRNLASDYAQLAAGPTGNGVELFAVVAVIYALCLLICGWRRQRRGGA